MKETISSHFVFIYFHSSVCIKSGFTYGLSPDRIRTRLLYPLLHLPVIRTL